MTHGFAGRIVPPGRWGVAAGDRRRQEHSPVVPGCNKSTCNFSVPTWGHGLVVWGDLRLAAQHRRWPWAETGPSVWL